MLKKGTEYIKTTNAEVKYQYCISTTTMETYYVRSVCHTSTSSVNERRMEMCSSFALNKNTNDMSGEAEEELM